MEVEIKEPKEYERLLEIKIPTEKVKDKIDSLYQKYQKTLHINGFRKGKIPIYIIKGKFGDSIKEEAISDTIQEAYKEVIEKENFSPITQGIIKESKFSDEDGLHFKISFEVIPDIKPKNYKGIEVEDLPTTVSDKEVEVALLKLQDSKSIYTPLLIMRGALPGDMVSVDYEILYEDKGIIRKNKVSNYAIILGAPEVPQEITQGLINSIPGDRRKVVIRYPIDLKDEKLRGKLVEYEFVVREVKEKKLPEIDDEFAKDIGFNSLQELKYQIENEIKKEKENIAKSKILTQIINSLIADNPFEPPTSIVNAYLRPMLKRVGTNIDEETRKNLDEVAIWRAKREILLDQIAKLEDIKLTEEEIKSKLVENQKVSYEDTVKSLKKEGIFDSLIEEFKREKVLDFLVNCAKIKIGG
ncbi:MAG: trigger factor [bacterium]|nr:trigger factor [bacterium]